MLVPRPYRTRGSRRPLKPAALVVAGAAVAGIAAVVVRGVAVPEDRSAAPARRWEVAGSLRVGGAPGPLSSDGFRLFVSDPRRRTVSVVDPLQGAVERVLRSSAVRPGAAVLGPDGRLWVGAVESDRVVPFNLRSGRPGDPVEVGEAPAALASDGSHLWVAAINGGVVARVTPPDVVRRLLAVPFPAAVATGMGRVWVADVTRDSVFEIDPATVTLRAAHPVGRSPTSLTVAGGRVWVGLYGQEALTALDPVNGETVSVPLGSPPGAVTAGAGLVWATLPERDALVGVDPTSTRVVVGPLQVGDAPQGVAVAGGDVWVANQGDGTLTRARLR